MWEEYTRQRRRKGPGFLLLFFPSLLTKAVPKSQSLVSSHYLFMRGHIFICSQFDVAED